VKQLALPAAIRDGSTLAANAIRLNAHAATSTRPAHFGDILAACREASEGEFLKCVLRGKHQVLDSCVIRGHKLQSSQLERRVEDAAFSFSEAWQRTNVSAVAELELYEMTE
jgi:hypothetical protein